MLNLPDFPWDSLRQAKAKAATHPQGLIDLSVGTPTDPTPDIATAALRAAAQSPGYPQVMGTPALRSAIRSYLGRRWGANSLADENVLPTLGSKELVALLPTLLGLGAEDTVVIPKLAYPTYEVGVRLAGCQVLRADSAMEAARVSPKLIWINSPANPHGRILSAAELRSWVVLARNNDAILASDECYGEFGWDAEPVSVLHPSANGGKVDNLLGVFSLSKRSNMAGYRAAFVAGDDRVVSMLLEARKHIGMMVPGPVQAAMVAVLDDFYHVANQRQTYLYRRGTVRSALEQAGFRVEDSQGSLYLWATRGEDCRASVDFFAQRGILVAPGDFYSAESSRHIRVSLTAPDAQIGSLLGRL